MSELGQDDLPIVFGAALNERHYGDLVGLNKDEARQRWGEEQVHLWQRSYDIAPPGGESLKDTAARALPFYSKRIAPELKEGKSVIVVGHGNTLRALVMQLDRLSPEQVKELNIGTGMPLIYRLRGRRLGRREARPRRLKKTKPREPCWRRALSTALARNPRALGSVRKAANTRRLPWLAIDSSLDLPMRSSRSSRTQ